MLIVDTREKKWEHIKNYFETHNIPFEIRKLDQGDYLDSDNPRIVVDRKRNLNEVASNLCSNDSSRFWREIRHAKENGIKLIVLVEHSKNIKSVKDVEQWSSHFSKVTGKRIVHEMFRCHVAYGVIWEFCDKAHTGQRILELIGYDSRGN